MRRRDFIAGLAGVAALPLPAARAQSSAIPVIGYLSGISEKAAAAHHVQFLRGLRETGFEPGRDVMIQYRWAEGDYDRLPGFAADFVRQSVAVILAQTPPAALAAKAATATIPIVFVVGIDPVAAGLVASYSRPGGNATGAAMIIGPLGQKRLEIVRELVPNASVVAFLHNPLSPDAAPEIRDVQTAARANNVQLRLVNASTRAELETALATIGAQRPDALLIGGDPFLLLHRQNIITQVARIRLVTVYPLREFVGAGGLISYGASISDSFRQAGAYVGRVLKGSKPTDLPVIQPTTFELVINQTAAKALGIVIPPTLHARSDEVIE